MTVKPVIILFNVSHDANSLEEILKRQLTYVSTFKALQESDFSKAIILVSGARIDSSQYGESIDLIEVSAKSISPILFSVKALRLLKRKNLDDSKLFIIAGTPLQPLLIGRYLKSRFKSAKLQLSIHTDLNAWFSRGAKNFIKRMHLRLSVSKVDLFRFVSEEQRDSACSLFSIQAKQTVVCPIPLDFPSLLSDSAPSSHSTLGFVGRIHPDRGVNEWIEIANRLNGFSFLVVGDGPLFEQFRRGLPHARFKGRVQHREIFEAYSQMSILLSCAPFESYGLSIREALLCKVPVVTKNTLGVRVLVNKFPEIVKSYETVDEAVSIIENLNSGVDDKHFEEYKKWFNQQQEEYLKALVSRWT